MMPTRLAVGLEPLNALDAAHRSPRSVFHSELVPPLTRSSRIIKRNKELAEIWNRWRIPSTRTKSDAILHCRP